MNWDSLTLQALFSLKRMFLWGDSLLGNVIEEKSIKRHPHEKFCIDSYHLVSIGDKKAHLLDCCAALVNICGVFWKRTNANKSQRSHWLQTAVSNLTLAVEAFNGCRAPPQHSSPPAHKGSTGLNPPNPSPTPAPRSSAYLAWWHQEIPIFL